MPKNQKYTSVRVRNETFDQIGFISKKSGLSKAQLLADVFEALFNVSCTYGALNLNYEYVISESKVTIQCEGKNLLISGEMKSPNAEEESKVSPIVVEVKPTKQKVKN